MSSGNGVRFAARPLTHEGTPTQDWLAALTDARELDVSDCTEIVVVAAHPDDETLGFGATLATLADLGVRIQVVAASDGGASHPALVREDLERRRRTELQSATAALGVGAPICLGLPDGDLAAHEDRLADRITDVLAARPNGTWCAATWRGDGHPDHEAVGRAAAVAAGRAGAVLLEYPVWMWHWATPGDVTVPWDRIFAMPATEAATARKASAARCYRSQLETTDPAAPAILPPFVVRRLLAVPEVAFR